MARRDRPTEGKARGKRHSRIATGCHILTLVIGSMYVLAFVLAIWTGYLSWIGIAVGALLTVPGVISPLLGLAGRKRLSTVLAEIGVGLTILTAIVLQVSLLRAKSDRAGNWRPYRFDNVLAAMEARRAVPDAVNAACHYESVFARIDTEDEPDFLFIGSSLRDEFGRHPWKDADHPQASEWLDSYSEVIDELLAIGRMEKCRWPIQADTYDEYTVPYRKLRRSVLLLMAAGNRDFGERRVAAALAKYGCVIRIADHLHQQPSTVDSLTGFSAEGIGLEMIRHVLVQSDLSGDDIAGIADRLPPAADLWPQEWERLLEHDKLHYMNLLGRIYEVDEEGNVRFAGKIAISPKDEREHEDPAWIPRIYWLISMPRDPRAVSDIADSYFAEFDHEIISAHVPRTDRDSGAVRDMAKAACNFYRWGIEMAFFNEREYVDHRQWRAPSITKRRGTWLVLGLRRYRDAHGVWPATLDAVSEDVPAEAFFDPAVGESFVYIPDGDEFKLYSKGANGVDDGGRSRYVRVSDKIEDDIGIWPPYVREPEPESTDKESLKRQFEQIYGKEYAEAMFRKDPNGKP
jgi:hypothetical protein